jgi:methyl-accepting chemotaxis protein
MDVLNSFILCNGKDHILTPLSIYKSYFSTALSLRDIRTQIEERALLFFNFYAHLVGLYSCYKWLHYDHSALVSTSIVVFVATFASSIAIKNSMPTPLSANLSLGGVSIHMLNVIYHTGGISSPHVFWIPAVIMASYLLTRGFFTHFWVVVSFLFLVFLVYLNLSDTALELVSLSDSEWRNEKISGYFLPFLMIWITQSYITRIARQGVINSEASQEQAEQRAGLIEKQSQQLSTAFEQIKQTVNALAEDADVLSKTAQHMKQSSQVLSDGANQQAELSELNQQTLTKLSEDSDTNAADVDQIRQLASHSKTVVEQSSESMQATILAMKQINTSYEDIYHTVSVITDIANKTNLLALNAAIEAARAGDQGRGFSIVADEVRKLSSLCNESAEAIRVVLDNSRQVVTDGNQMVEQTDENLQRIVNDVTQITDSIVKVTDTLMSQKSDVDELEQKGQTVLEIASNNQKTAADFHQNTESLISLSNNLSSLAKSLSSTLKLGE